MLFFPLLMLLRKVRFQQEHTMQSYLRDVSLSWCHTFGSSADTPEKDFGAWGPVESGPAQEWGVQGKGNSCISSTSQRGTWLCTLWDPKLLWKHSTCSPKILFKCKILRFECANYFPVIIFHDYTPSIFNLQFSVVSVSKLYGLIPLSLKLTDIILWEQIHQHVGFQRYFIII